MSLFGDRSLQLHKNRKLLLLTGKVLVSAILLSVIFKKAGVENILRHLGTMDMRYFVLSSLLYMVTVCIAAVRWGLLLDKKYPVGRLISLYFVGSFFNHILPGTIGGDTVKMYYLYKETKSGGSSIGSVFLDRYIGLVALLSLGLVSSVIGYREMVHVGQQWLVPSVFAAFIAGSLLVFGFRIGSRFTAIRDFYDYFHAYLKRRRTLFLTFLLSLVVHVITIGMIYLIALGMGQLLPLTDLFVFVPIIITVTSIPLSISGLGVREGAFTLLFGLAGVPPQVCTSISFLWFLSMAATSLIGLVEYFRYRKQ